MLAEINDLINNISVIIENTSNDQVVKITTAVKEDLIRLRENYTTKMTTHNANVDMVINNTETIGDAVQALPGGGYDASKDLAEVSMLIANLKLD
jgi:hypothetical protein